jgi:predicted transcriptional regulator of viral defense system
MPNAIQTAVEIFKTAGGVLRTREAIELGINHKTLYKMIDDGQIGRISRGVYILSGFEFSALDLVTVTKRVPKGVICLVSALDFHGITTQIPSKVEIAITPGMRPIAIDYPPVKYYYYEKQTFKEGVVDYKVDSFSVRVFNPEKTIVDCFKFRNRLGMDIVLEALKLLKETKGLQLATIINYAKLARVDNIIKPYLQSLM